MKTSSFMFVAAGALLLLWIGLTAGCTQSPAQAPAPEPTMVSVSYPVERNVTDYADFTGRTAAVHSVEVRARVDGYLDAVKFKEGALVNKGDVLFVIDPRPFVAELNRAKALLEESKANYTQSLAQLNEAKARENRAVAGVYYTQRRLARSERLLPGNVITQEEFDLQKSELDQSQADLQRARATVASSQAAIGTAKAAVQTAQAAVELAELNLDYSNVTAPIDGRIGRELVTEGNLVQAGQNPGGTLLTTIVSVDPMYVYFDIDEGTDLKIRRLIREGKARSARDNGQPVLLGLANEEGFPHRGTVNFVDNQINPRTGTLRLRGVLANKDEFLSPGYFVRVRLPISEPHQALLVNERALESNQGQRIIYVVNEKNEVVARDVELGARHDGLREIKVGLAPRDLVVVNGLQHVQPGASVETELVEMQSESGRESSAVAASASQPARSVTRLKKS
jgi:RND family efflux transporter MFP subunit